MRRATLALLALAALGTAATCLKPDPAPRFTPAWEPFDPGDARWITTRAALLISDCQIHNLLSKALPERNLSSESLAATAIRPPQLDLFSRDVLEWILGEGAQGTDVTLHLGDAMDLACQGEFNTFLEVMDSSPRPWFMAPGNHDFYYFGSYDPEDLELWAEACFRAGGPLSKDRFIRLYVAALLRRQDERSAALAEALGLTGRRSEPLATLADALPGSFEWQAAGEAPGFLERIAWSIDPQRPYRSFLLQSIDMTRPSMEAISTRVLLLDSCQYGRRPELVPNAWKTWPLGLNCGYTGEMLPDQLRTIRRWMEEGMEDSGFVLMCHHPFDSLAPRTRASLGWLWRERRGSMMVTAHTHAGYFAHHDLDGESEKLELNLGSTVDWPMEWRTLTAFVDPQREQIYARAERHTLVDELSNRQGFFELGWEVPLDAPDDYRKYKQGEPAQSILFDFYLAHHLVPYWMPAPHIRANKAARETEEQVKDTLLWTYLRLVELFPTDPQGPAPSWPAGCASDGEVLARIRAATAERDALEDKIDFLAELEAFERGRSTRDRLSGEASDDARRRFKLSQASWASRFESAQGRRLRLDDELIRIQADPQATQHGREQIRATR